MKNVIEIERMRKSYGEKLIFSNVDMYVKQGEVVGIIGENGCGKSVLLKIICGLENIDSGQVLVNGQRISCGKTIQEVGMLINSAGYIEKYTGIENLEFLANIKGVISRKDIIKVMRLIGLERKKDEKVKNYSQGMKRRLGIVQAIMEGQNIIVLDEVLSGLDVQSRNRVVFLIEKLKCEKKTIIMTGHNYNELFELCDSIYMIEKKNVVLVRKGQQCIEVS